MKWIHNTGFKKIYFSFLREGVKKTFLADILTQPNHKQELQEVLKFPIEIFWNLEASFKSEILYF